MHGVPVFAMDTLFALMLAAMLVTILQILGVTLIISAIVIPASIARLLSDRFGTMILSAILGASISFVGIYLSYYFDVASGASVVLLSTLVFGLVLLWTNYKQRRKRTVANLRTQHYD